MPVQFIINKLIAICIIAVFPAIIWFFKTCRSKRILFLGIYFIFVFISGSLEILGFNTTFLRIINESFIFLLLIGLLIKGRNIVLSYIYIISIFILISCLSLINLTNPSLLLLLLFLLRYLEVIILFYGFVNFNLSKDENRFITTLIIKLSIAQIFASIIKVIILGHLSEPYIGTMSVRGGELTTIFSLAAFSFAIIYYLIFNDKKYLLVAFGFVLFAISGEKRASAFYIPIFYFLSLFIYQYITGVSRHINKYLFISFLVVPIIFYTMIRANPSFNKEKKIWGAFDINYALNYSDKYLKGNKETKDAIGRSAAFSYVHNKLLNESASKIILGYGAGELIQSSFNENINSYKGSVGTYTIKKYGIGYGLAPGYLRLLVQVGFLGSIIYLLFFFILLMRIIKGVKTEYLTMLKSHLAFTIGGIMCLISSLFIFILYSDTPFYLNPVSIVLFWFIAKSYRISVLKLKY